MGNNSLVNVDIYMKATKVQTHNLKTRKTSLFLKNKF